MIENLLIGGGVSKTLINNVDAAYPVTEPRGDGSLIAPGFMGVFMEGLFSVFDQQGTFTFTVPDAITKLRVRCLGRGSAGNAYQGGSGGGYAHGVFTVTPGEQFTLKIPDLRTNALTQAEFGNVARGILLRATNGTNVGGQGYGGDYQSAGGGGASTGFERAVAGSAAGSQISKTGGGVAGVSSYGGGGARGYGGMTGNDYAGGAVGNATAGANGAGVSLTGLTLPPGFPRFPLDGLYGAGNSGLPGAGGGSNVFPGVCGGSGVKTGTVLQVVYGGGLHNYLGGQPLVTSRGLIVIEY